jgi:uncharacterized caspase-like protein
MGKYALLIGTDTYGEGLQPLPAAPKDVAALQEVLLNPEMGGFDEAKSLINPTQPDMAREIELWFQDRQPEDLVLLFFSGHGVKDDRRDLYFAAANTEKVRDRLVRSTATSARFLHDCIRGCKAKYQVLILDCCFSGAFGDLVGRDDGEIPLKEQLGAEGRVVLTSTSAVDYSFEEKGADLSIYTRYLVEGIATGAADEDGDGVITVDELHRYAGRKVKETSPIMSPCLITLKDEGFRIRVARSPQDDPRLKYRKEAERRATAAEFTIPAQRLLIRLRAELGLSDVEVEAIEAEVLKPHREYQRKRQEYRETLNQCLERESPLNQRTIQDLKDYRAHLRLKPEDVAAIERAALNGQNLEGYIADHERQQQVQQQIEAQRRRQDQAEAEQQQREAEAEQKRRAEALLERYVAAEMERQRQAQQQIETKRRQDQAEAEQQQREAEAEQKRQAETEVQRQREAAEQKRQTKSAAQRQQEEAERRIQAIWGKVKQLWTPDTTEQLTEPNQTKETNLSSEKSIDYTRLRDLLKAGKWRKADKETYEVMIRAVGKKSGDWFTSEELRNFPCTDLRTIDGLWVKYSQGKFGFSVQKQIYVETGNPLDGEYNDETWEKFCDRVGWRKGNKYLNYSDLKANPSLSPVGEFPNMGNFQSRVLDGCWVLFSRAETCEL